MTARNVAIFYMLVISLVHGVTYTIAKDVMNGYVQPSGFILIRIIGAGILFWLMGYTVPKEKIDHSDIPRLILAGLFGASLNMLFFYKGLNLTTPISASVIMVNAPILVMFLSAILLREKLVLRKVIGIVIGVTGAGVLIIMSKKAGQLGTNPGLGNFYVFLNAFFYGLYLIIVKKLMHKYNPFTLIKWMYLVGFFCLLPYGWEEALAIQWSTMPLSIALKVAFIILFTTFLNYSLVLKSIKVLSPTTVSVFIYLQPLLATVFSISVGKDSLDWTKIVSAILIFTGVYLVSFGTKKAA